MGRRQFTPEFKTKIVVELLREEKLSIMPIRYIYEYNTERPHQTYNYMTPIEVYLAQRIAA